MARDKVKKELSDAAREATAKKQLVSVGLGDAELKALKERYGERAYDLISAAMFPDNVQKALGNKTFKKPAATIKDFISQLLTEDQILKITEKKADIVERREETKQELKSQAQKAHREQPEKTEIKAKDQPLSPTIDYTRAPEKNISVKMDCSEQNQPKVIDKQLTLTPDTTKVRITEHTISSGRKKKLTFTSSAQDKQGVTIPELAGATKDSLWDVTYQREVANEENPVGGVKQYWGSMQYNTYAAKSMAMYALTKPEYKDIAQKFFKPGYEKALADFQQYAKEKGNNVAYWQENKYHTKLAGYIKPEYKALFVKEGKNNAGQFLQLQRDFTSEIYISQTKSRYERIVKALEKKGMKPEDVNPAIWGMVLSSGIHYKTKLSAIATLFERPGVDKAYINSPQMVEDIKRTDPGTFNRNENERQAAQYAKDHVHEKHSATTSRELAIILGRPEIYTDYLELVAGNSVKTANGTYIAKGQTPKTVTQTARIQQTQSQTM